MLRSVHVQMTRLALDGLFSERALQVIIRANVGMDAVWNQIGRHELHFDDNAFERSYAYLAGQRACIQPALEAGTPRVAWQAFGRLTHTAQDFYSHSNYVDLWAARHQPGRLPPADQIDPVDRDLMNNPALHSGRIHLPLEILSYVPVVGAWMVKSAPSDSHARMHRDSAARGPLFEYAFQAAVRRTRQEYDELTHALPAPLLAQFRELPG